MLWRRIQWESICNIFPSVSVQLIYALQHSDQNPPPLVQQFVILVLKHCCLKHCCDFLKYSLPIKTTTFCFCFSCSISSVNIFLEFCCLFSVIMVQNSEYAKYKCAIYMCIFLVHELKVRGIYITDTMFKTLRHDFTKRFYMNFMKNS